LIGRLLAFGSFIDYGQNIRLYGPLELAAFVAMGVRTEHRGLRKY
jgi:hypothetical protein